MVAIALLLLMDSSKAKKARQNRRLKQITFLSKRDLLWEARMNLTQLRYFVAIARNRSFSRAAVELHVAQ